MIKEINHLVFSPHKYVQIEYVVFEKAVRPNLSVITHFFLELLDAFFLFDRIGIRTQTRSAVVTHGLENKTDGYLGIFDSFCVALLQYVATPNGWRWLGGVAMTHADRRHGPAYIPRA